MLVSLLSLLQPSMYLRNAVWISWQEKVHTMRKWFEAEKFYTLYDLYKKFPRLTDTLTGFC